MAHRSLKIINQKRETAGLEPLLVSVPTAARITDRGVSTIWRDIKLGLLETVKVDGSTRITYESLKKRHGLEAA